MEKNIPKKFVLFAIITTLITLTGCATMPIVQQRMEQTTLKWKMPYIEPLKETVIAQEKGEILISIVPQSYSRKRDIKTDETPYVATDPLSFLLTPTDGSKYYDQRIIPIPKLEPDRLQFILTIHNRLNRVFRGAGSVVSFNVDRKVIAVDQAGYTELLNVIIPPRGQAQAKITGPKLDSLPDKCIVGVFIYDVVTKVDNVGNPKEKANYEWYFDFSTNIVEEAAPVEMKRIKRNY